MDAKLDCQFLSISRALLKTSSQTNICYDNKWNNLAIGLQTNSETILGNIGMGKHNRQTYGPMHTLQLTRTYNHASCFSSSSKLKIMYNLSFDIYPPFTKYVLPFPLHTKAASILSGTPMNPFRIFFGYPAIFLVPLNFQYSSP